METKLNLITEIARKDRKCKFKNLAHLLNSENLKKCFWELKRGKASGIDGVTLKEYESNIDNNLKILVNKMKNFSYRPLPVKRVYISKANGKSRPLGIPSVEDKIVQKGITKILQAIFEVDFLDCSYGFRPNKNCHQALSALDKMIMTNPVNYVIDADIENFFEDVDHEWLMKCVEQRINDQKLLRLLKRFLKAGIMEEKIYLTSNKGTPQGGLISPVLANIYLHYILDLWFEKVEKVKTEFYIGIIRYCDDFVICVQRKELAETVLSDITKRLDKFGLKLSKNKTHIVEFGRYAGENSRKKGLKSGSFNFLGFTHFCDVNRNGKFKVGRKTERKRFAVKIKQMKVWLSKSCRICKPKVWWPILAAKLRGHFQYYGVSGNFKGISWFSYSVIKLVFKWLNRRSQKKSYNWKKFNVYLKRHTLPKPKIHHNLYALYG